MHLDLDDLLNVADANKYLRIAAWIPFKRKYTGKPVDIHATERQMKILKMQTWTPNDKYVLTDALQIYSPKMSFQLLRIFGNTIIDLTLFYSFLFAMENHYQEHHHIFSYMKKFCADSLFEFCN